MRILYFLLLPLVGVAAEPLPDVTASSSEEVGTDAKSATIETKAKQERVKRNQALAKLRADKQEETEVLLADLSPTPKNSPDWHFELAMNLIRVAYDARATGDEVAAKKAAQRAVKHFDKAERGYTDQTVRLSAMQELRGVLQEDFLGTSEEAEAYFREAARLNPDSESAKERVMRLDRNKPGKETNYITQTSAAAADKN
jgi:hypothetical protein